MEERRRFPRVQYPCKITVSLEQEPEEFNLKTENISSGGARVFMPKLFKVNTPAGIEVTIDTKVIKTTGRIAWVLDIKDPKDGSKTLFDTGIEFTHLNPSDKDFLTKLIEDILAKSTERSE
jgi:c-di-GMP-binding flagellar brake protein YcgR